jgi:hypothetical protein
MERGRLGTEPSDLAPSVADLSQTTLEAVSVGTHRLAVLKPTSESTARAVHGGLRGP